MEEEDRKEMEGNDKITVEDNRTRDEERGD